MTKKRVVSITIDEDILEWVDEAAKGTEMSRSEFINFVLSGGRDSKEMLDNMIDRIFNQRKSDLKDALTTIASSRSGFAKKEER